MYRVYSLPLAILLFLFFAGHASASSHCEFRLGFKTLRDLIGHHIVGECLENEHYNHIGDSNQHTTGGLMAWRKADNWTAFTDGYRTWVNGPYGLVQRLNTERFEWEADYAEIVQGVKPTPTPTPAASTSASTPTLATGGLGDSLSNPASNEHAVISDGILVFVPGFVPDATRFVLAVNIFNDEPESGNRYYMITVGVLNLGGDTAEVSNLDFKFIGHKRTVYDFSDDCGVIHNELDVELYPSGHDVGHLCFEVPKNERDFVLIYEPLFSFDDSLRRYIRLPNYCPNREVIEGIESCKSDFIVR